MMQQPMYYQQNNPANQFYNNRMREVSNPYPYYQQQQPQQVSRPVTSIEEARAAIIDNPINTYIFTNFANNEIYSKYILNDGTARLDTYVKVNQPQQTVITSHKDNTDIDLLKSQIKDMEMKVIELTKEIETLKGEKKDDELNANSTKSKNGK